MPYNLERLTSVDGDAILPLADCRAHLRVDNTDEDDLIAALRDSAIDHVERMSGVALAPTEYRWTVPAFASRIDLPVGPVTEISGISYAGDDGAPVTFTDFRMIGPAAYPLVGSSWPTSNGYVAVEFTAGLTPGPPALLAAVKLMLGHLFDQRSATSNNTTVTVPLGVEALVMSYRRMVV